MNLVVTNAVLLPFLGLLLVPFLLHLFARARPPQYLFSSVDFLRKVARKTIRLRRPQSLLVLLLRTLLFAAVVGLFLKPLYFGRQRLPGLGTQRNVVILVDATASMAAVEGAQTRFAAACARAAEVLSELSGSDTANVIWLGTPNRVVFLKPGVNFAYLTKVLRQAGVTSEAADVNGAFAQAAEMLAGLPGAREIYVFSDFQKGTWAGVQPAVPPGIHVYAVKVGQADPSNTALVSVTLDPANPLVGEDVTVLCEVVNYSPENSLGSVYLTAGQAHQSRELRLTPWQKGSVAFQIRCQAPGEQAVAVSLSEDVFPYDNQQWATFDGVERLRVGIYGAEPETADWWRKAVNALGWARAEPVSEAQLVGNIQPDVLLLAGWTGETRERDHVKAYLESGGAVIWYPAPPATLPAIASLAGTEAGVANAPGGLVWEHAEQPFKLAVADPRDRVFQVFSGGVYGDPSRGAFKARLRIPATAFPGSHALLSFRDGTPALVRLGKHGRLFLWNLPLQRQYSDWALQPEFLPFLGELLLHNRRAASAAALRAFLPGQMLLREFDREVLDSDVTLQRGEENLKVARQSGAGVRFASAEARVPGLYTWRYRGQPLAQQVVNFPGVESDLRSQPPPRFAEGAALTLTPGQSLRQLREGTPLWPQLLALTLVLALVEGLILLRTDRK